MLKVLITGATGYLGSRLLRRIVALPHYTPIVLKRSDSDDSRIAELLTSIRSYEIDRHGLEPAFREQPIDAVIHLATNYGGTGASHARLVESNLLFPLRLVELARQHRVPVFLNAHTALPRSVSGYTLSKHQFCEWLRLASSELLCLNVAVEQFFGPGDNAERFVMYVLRSMLRGESELKLTKGEQLRDFVYIDDVVEGFVTLLARASEFEPGWREFEIGTGQPVAVKDVVLLLRDLTECREINLRFGAVAYRDHEVMKSSACIDAMRRLGWTPRFSLVEGLKRTIQGERERHICPNAT